jgi:hypothetical protein
MGSLQTYDHGPNEKEGALMSESAIVTIVCFIILLATLIISEKVRGNRVKKAVCLIVQELNKAGAHDLFTAVELPQLRMAFLHWGYRSSWSSAVEILSRQNAVRKTGSGKLFLRMRSKDERLQQLLETCAIDS